MGKNTGGLLDYGTRNLIHSYYDEFAQENAEAKRNAGVGSVIKRVMLGGCCDYCKGLAGTYNYKPGEYPEAIFSRHRDCRCLVTVKTEGHGFTDVWSKKEYDTNREAIIAREKEILDSQKNVEDYLRRKNEARARGERYIDVTDYWNKKTKEYPAYVFDTHKEFEYDGEFYTQHPGVIFIKNDENEIRIAELWKEKYGGIIQRIPEIKIPENVKTPDYLINGIRYDLKTPTGASKTLIENNIGNQELQAKRFIIDISKTPKRREDLIAEAKRVMQKRNWIEEIVMIDGETTVMVLERV